MPISYDARQGRIRPHRGAHNEEFNFLLQCDPVDQCTSIPICLNTRVSDMIASILSVLGSSHTIKILRILSHGAPGTVSIGENIAMRNQASFSALRGKFSATSEGIFLYGCRIASIAMQDTSTHILSLTEGTCRTYLDYDSPAREFQTYMQGDFNSRTTGVSRSIGFSFIAALAETVGVNVTAAVDRQMDDPHRVGHHHIERPDTNEVEDHDDNGHYYEGRYVTVTPSGTHTLRRGRSFQAIFTATCSHYSP
mgnify:CR=1 FL=1